MGAKTKIILGNVVWYTVATLLAIYFIFPLYWMLVSSFSSLEQLFSQEFRLWPDPIVFNLKELNKYMMKPSLLNAYKNSFLITLSAIPRVFVSMLSGFALARLRGKGSNIVFYFIIATVMLPVSVTLYHSTSC